VVIIGGGLEGDVMSGLGKWSLGIGVVLLVAAVAAQVLGQIPVTVIVGILGLLALGMAAYDALYEWTKRVQERRQAARSSAARERELREGR
jgi:cadmium resistance protein CadD (predicted permease)